MAKEKLQIILDAVWQGKGAVRGAEQDVGRLEQAAKKNGITMQSMGKLEAVASIEVWSEHPRQLTLSGCQRARAPLRRCRTSGRALVAAMRRLVRRRPDRSRPTAVCGERAIPVV